MQPLPTSSDTFSEGEVQHWRVGHLEPKDASDAKAERLRLEEDWNDD